jgi:CelD/BcsL family acetyltransferase involved in cellulose biosynthesis
MLSEVIQSQPELLAIKEEWQALSASLPQSIGFFGGWDFAWHYIEVIKPEKWFVVALRDPEKKQLVAVFAWELVNLQAGDVTYRAVQPLGSSLTPYVEFTVVPRHLRPVLQTLLNTVLAQQVHIDVACLWPLHEASPIYHTLTEDMRHSDLLSTFRYPGNLREIETRGLDYAAYCRSKPGSSFANARYCERRLGKEGALRFTLCEPLPAADDIVERLCAASAARFGEQFAYRAKPGWKAFVGELVNVLADQGIAQVSTLRFNQAIIASSLSFWHKGRRYFYLTHYDRAYAHRSPGKILLYRLIEQTFADKGVFCFGAGTYSYKEDWAQSTGELKAAFIFLNEQARRGLDTVIDRDFIVRLGQV